MRPLILLALLCIRPGTASALPAPPELPFLDSGPAPTERHDGPPALAVFVRDRFGHARAIALRLPPTLADEGLRIDLLQSGADLQPRWTEDDSRASALAVPYWVRVDIRRWRERGELVRLPHAGWRPRAGLVIGIADVMRPEEPELEGPMREPVDDGDTSARHELRVDVAVSVHRTGEEIPLLRCRLVEGALRLDDKGNEDESDEQTWTRIYDELATRLAERVAGAIAVPLGATVVAPRRAPSVGAAPSDARRPSP